MNPSFDLSKEMLADYWNIAVHTETDLSQKELAAELLAKCPPMNGTAPRMSSTATWVGYRRCWNP